MNKKLIMGLLSGVTLLLASGCEEENVYFEGKKVPADQAEEIIEDRLEDENGLDYEVDIYRENE